MVKRYAGNGQKAWKALEEKYNACSNATRQELYDSLGNTKLQRGQDPDEFLYHMETARNRLRDGGADHRRLLQPHDPHCSSSGVRVRAKHQLQRSQIQDFMTTIRNIYANLLSRPSTTSSVVGRGVAMHVQGDVSGKTCRICKEQGHFRTDCPKYDPNYKKNNRRQSAKKGQGSGSRGGTKWCSLHRYSP